MAWTIEDLDEGRIEAAGACLARSFVADPLAVHMFPEESARRELLPWHFSAVVRLGVKFGRVLTTRGKPLGAAVWLKPGEGEMTEERIVAAELHRAPEVLGESAWNRFTQAVAYLEEIHAHDLPEDHWYLMVLGVAPEQQGRGLGSALMQPILEQADREGRKCYLETAEITNVPYYEKRGFRVLRQGAEESSGVPYWTFSRNPRAR